MEFTDPTPQTYTLERVLEMLCGYEYYSYDQVQFVFHRLNGNEEQAQYHLARCREEADRLREQAAKLKAPETEPLENTLSQIKSDDT